MFLNFFFNAVTSDETEWECVLELFDTVLDFRVFA